MIEMFVGVGIAVMVIAVMIALFVKFFTWGEK